MLFRSKMRSLVKYTKVKVALTQLKHNCIPCRHVAVNYRHLLAIYHNCRWWRYRTVHGDVFGNFSIKSEAQHTWKPQTHAECN